jgi:hypothetical protein
VKETKMKDSASHFYHEHQNTRQNWRIASWCLKKGIAVDTIEGHPYYEDILFLVQFQDEFETEYKSNAVDYNCFRAYWSIVIKDRKPLNTKAFAKFERIAHNCMQIRQQQQAKLNQIHALRKQQAPAKIENMDHDMMAKGSCSPQKLTHKGANESAVEKSLVPWE